jgi:hypothetical protein
MYHSGLELWWFAIENICGLDSTFDNSNGAIEKSHQMTSDADVNAQ